MITKARKITSKGQITIPKEIREKLGTASVFFEVVNEDVMIRPVKDASGSLNKYVRNVKKSTSIRQMKEKSWEDVVQEKQTTPRKRQFGE
jgi:AbrB family looped-hinge helix DNA binding protein